MDWFSHLEPLFSQWSYLAVFTVLVLCGVGLPVPEEITFITAGYVVSSGEAYLWPMITVSLSGLLIGDSLIYFFGRHFGLAILQNWPFCILFSVKMLERSRHFFDAYGSKGVFFAGFLAGVRATTFFLCGSMRFSYWRFLFWDLARSLLTCPISIWAGYKFGPYADEWLGAHVRYVFAAILVLGVLMIVRGMTRRVTREDFPKPG